MLIGCVRVSKSDGTQTLAPQRDAMLAAGVDPTRIYEDLASGRHDARPGLTACLKAMQPGNTLVLWKRFVEDTGENYPRGSPVAKLHAITRRWRCKVIDEKALALPVVCEFAWPSKNGSADASAEIASSQ